jgi:hypothetical protein
VEHHGGDGLGGRALSSPRELLSRIGRDLGAHAHAPHGRRAHRVTMRATRARTGGDGGGWCHRLLGMTPTHRPPRRPRPTSPHLRAIPARAEPGPESAAASLFWSVLSVCALCVVGFYGAQVMRVVVAAIDAARQ